MISNEGWRAKHTALLALIVLLALLTRLYGITGESAWHDEALTLKHIAAPTLSAYVEAAFEEDPWTLLSQGYHHVQYAWRSVFGPSELSIRLLSVALSLLTLPLIAGMGYLLSGVRAGLLAAALFAFAMPHVYYAQETRFYALITFESALAMLGLLMLLQRRSAVGGAVHLIGNAAALFTHAFTPLLFAAQGAFLLGHWRRQPAKLVLWFVCQVALIVCFFAWVRWGIAYEFGARSETLNDLPPTWREFIMTYVVFAGGRFSNIAPSEYMPLGLSLDGLVALAIFGCGMLGVSGLSLYRADARNPRLFLLAWLLVPVVLLFLVSLGWRPAFFYRYVLASSIPLLLLAAIALTSIRSDRIRRGAIAALLVALAWQNFALERPFRPDFRAFATEVHADSPADGVLAMKYFVSLGAQYNLGDEYEVHTLYGMNDLQHEIRQRLSDGGALWVVFHRWHAYGSFEEPLESDGIDWTRHEYAGIPPLVAYRLEVQP